MAQGGIDGKRHALLTGNHLVLHVTGHLIEPCLLLDGFLDLLAHMYDGEIDETHALRGIETRSSLHQADITLADEVFHRHAPPFILTGYGHHEAQVGLYEFRECAVIALPDTF